MRRVTIRGGCRVPLKAVAAGLGATGCTCFCPPCRGGLPRSERAGRAPWGLPSAARGARELGEGPWPARAPSPAATGSRASWAAAPGGCRVPQSGVRLGAAACHLLLPSQGFCGPLRQASWAGGPGGLPSARHGGVRRHPPGSTRGRALANERGRTASGPRQRRDDGGRERWLYRRVEAGRREGQARGARGRARERVDGTLGKREAREAAMQIWGRHAAEGLRREVRIAEERRCSAARQVLA